FIYTHANPDLFGNLAKVFSLLICAVSLTNTQNAFSANDTPQKAWTFIAGSMWIWFFAQVILFYIKILVHDPDYYPSLADLFFSLSYLPLIIGVIFLIKDFRSTGLPMGSRNSYIIQAVVLLVVYGIIFATLLYQLAIRPDPPATKFLNVGYPTFDFIVIAL